MTITEQVSGLPTGTESVTMYNIDQTKFKLDSSSTTWEKGVRRNFAEYTFQDGDPAYPIRLFVRIVDEPASKPNAVRNINLRLTATRSVADSVAGTTVPAGPVEVATTVILPLVHGLAHAEVQQFIMSHQSIWNGTVTAGAAAGEPITALLFGRATVL